MENMTTKELSNIKILLGVTLSLLASVTLIVLAMPKTEVSALSYSVGEPWMNPQLISPGEILIKKNPTEVQKEREDALRNEFTPYYDFSEDKGETQLRLFAEKCKADSAALTNEQEELLRTKLLGMYAAGIMPQADYSQMMSADSNASIMCVTAKEATARRVRELRSTKMAYEEILADESLAGSKELLKKNNLNVYIQANVTYDEELSNKERDRLLAMIPENSGQMKLGQEIIDRGEIVTEEKALMIESYNDFMNSESNEDGSELGVTNITQWLYVMMLFVLILMYLYFFRRDYLSKAQSLTMLFSLLTVFPIINSLMIRYAPDSVYIVPLCLVPMFIRVFLDSRTAFMTHTILVLICAATVVDKFEFVLVQMAAGAIAICSLRELVKRSQLLLSALYILLAYLVAYTIVRFMDSKVLALDSLRYPYFTFLMNCVMLLLTYPLMFIVEKMFGFVSPVTLIEISDTNRDLLRRLSEEAPGTFQHSIMVSNLAAAIASEVGAKSLLVRTGALYHDVGKLSHPVFFTENQSGVNPHSRMQPEESAKIILGHVTEGLRLAEKNGVPDVIRNFIITHHGTGKAKYFYTTYKKEHPDEPIDEKIFTYKGPNPFSREQAILMMADAVEAASRSLTEYTEKNIAALVNRIVDTQLAEGYFEECPITFRDVAIAKRVLKEKLMVMYHTRVQYPEENVKK